jgi:type VI protein secretion system component VasK
MEKGTITVNRYWKRMQKYRPGLFWYLTMGKTGYGNSKANQIAKRPLQASFKEKR